MRAEGWREITARGAALLPVLVAELRHDDPLHRCTAVSAIQALGVAAQSAAPGLLELVHREDAETSCHPNDALREVAPGVFAKELQRALRLRDARLCRALLGDLTWDGRVLSALLEALRLEGCRKEAASALVFSTDVRAAPALVAALTDPSREGREEMVEALGSLASNSRQGLKPWLPDVTKALIVALQDEDAGIRREAAEALAHLGPDAAPAAEALARALDDSHETVRWSAVSAIAAIGPAASGAGPALLRLESLPHSAAREGSLQRAIEVTNADKDEARLEKEDDIRAAVIDHLLTEAAARGSTSHFDLVVGGDPDAQRLGRALARRGVKAPGRGGVRLVFGRVEWTALDLVRVGVTFGGGMDSSGTTYVLALRGDRWMVIGTRGGWITEGPRSLGSWRTADEQATCRPAAPWALRGPRSMVG